MFIHISIFFNFLEFLHFPKITQKRSGFPRIQEFSFKVEILHAIHSWRQTSVTLPPKSPPTANSVCHLEAPWCHMGRLALYCSENEAIHITHKLLMEGNCRPWMSSVHTMFLNFKLTLMFWNLEVCSLIFPLKRKLCGEANLWVTPWRPFTQHEGALSNNCFHFRNRSCMALQSYML